LLAQLVPEFTVLPSNVDESLIWPDPWETAKALAASKADAIHKQYPGSLVIGADTIVAIQDLRGTWHQLAKPTDEADAIRMLRQLSGRQHIVITGVSLERSDFASLFTETTKVTFRPLSGEEIEAYVATGEPMDKAGAYAIQGGAQGFVETIEGSWSNVVGLPLEALAPVLEKALAMI
jgi:septum formation protein